MSPYQWVEHKVAVTTSMTIIIIMAVECITKMFNSKKYNERKSNENCPLTTVIMKFEYSIHYFLSFFKHCMAESTNYIAILQLNKPTNWWLFHNNFRSDVTILVLNEDYTWLWKLGSNCSMKLIKLRKYWRNFTYCW